MKDSFFCQSRFQLERNKKLIFSQQRVGTICLMDRSNFKLVVNKNASFLLPYWPVRFSRVFCV